MIPKQNRLLLSFSVVSNIQNGVEMPRAGKRDCPISGFLYNDPWGLGLYLFVSVQQAETRNLFRSPHSSKRTGSLILITTNKFTKQ